jgi:hypothetical protein
MCPHMQFGSIDSTTSPSSSSAAASAAVNNPALKTTTIAMFGVCDGHGDSRQCAEYVATQMPIALEQVLSRHASTSSSSSASTTSTTANILKYDSEEWGDFCDIACSMVDDGLAKLELPGGTTGIFTIITPIQIIVSNPFVSSPPLYSSSTATRTKQHR